MENRHKTKTIEYILLLAPTKLTEMQCVSSATEQHDDHSKRNSPGSPNDVTLDLTRTIGTLYYTCLKITRMRPA